MGKAVSELGYITRKAPASLPLIPKAHVEKGIALMELRRIYEAILEFQKAIKLKPDYYLAYVQLSGCYTLLGDKKKAKKILMLGIKKAKKLD